MTKRGRYHGMPRTVSLPGRRSYLIEQEPHRWFGYRCISGVWIVPDNGDASDQGSIPWIVRAFIPNDAYWAFYLHDSLYRKKFYRVFDMTEEGYPILSKRIGIVHVSRSFSDAVLWEAMRTENLDWDNGNLAEASAIFAGVRAGGWRAWNKKS